MFEGRHPRQPLSELGLLAAVPPPARPHDDDRTGEEEPEEIAHNLKARYFFSPVTISSPSAVRGWIVIFPAPSRS